MEIVSDALSGWLVERANRTFGKRRLNLHEIQRPERAVSARKRSLSCKQPEGPLATEGGLAGKVPKQQNTVMVWRVELWRLKAGKDM
jgi:hypothetical protein